MLVEKVRKLALEQALWQPNANFNCGLNRRRFNGSFKCNGTIKKDGC